MAIDYLNPGGINTFQNSLQIDSNIIHAVNVYSPGLGILAKRPGYGTIIGTVQGQVNSLFSFPFQNGTQLYLYAAAGSTLNYSYQGTGPWTVPTNGTIVNNAYVGNNVFNNVLSIGDGAGGIFRNSTNGTTFTTPGTYPLGAQYLADFHNRVYTADGTTNAVLYSVANDPTNWQNSGTSDANSVLTYHGGACAGIFVAGDRLDITQTRGGMFNWDDTSLVDMATKYGPSSPWSIAQIDDTWFYTNQYGIFQFDGANKTLISNPIQRQFYNRSNTGINTASLGTLPGVAHFWDYLVAVGTTTDDFTQRTIKNNIIKYDFQKNLFLNWSFNNAPTAFHSYADINQKRQLIFGDALGNIFQLDSTKTSDAGVSIPTEIVMLFNYSNSQEAFSQTSASTVSGSNYEKKWNWLRVALNSGCEINCQFAFSNSLDYQRLKWSEAINTRVGNGDYWQFSNGMLEIRFPIDPNNMPRSRFLFVRLYDDSDSSNWQYMGCQIDAEVQLIK